MNNNILQFRSHLAQASLAQLDVFVALADVLRDLRPAGHADFHSAVGGVGACKVCSVLSEVQFTERCDPPNGPGEEFAFQ